jgi:hypothetical protein
VGGIAAAQAVALAGALAMALAGKQPFAEERWRFTAATVAGLAYGLMGGGLGVLAGFRGEPGRALRKGALFGAVPGFATLFFGFLGRWIGEGNLAAVLGCALAPASVAGAAAAHLIAKGRHGTTRDEEGSDEA